jgi:murein DD-endopeptidase MepM/ murein hydrolase activator NlpD/fibronectin type 3 domain-containing protein
MGKTLIEKAFVFTLIFSLIAPLIPIDPPTAQAQSGYSAQVISSPSSPQSMSADEQKSFSVTYENTAPDWQGDWGAGVAMYALDSTTQDFHCSSWNGNQEVTGFPWVYHGQSRTKSFDICANGQSAGSYTLRFGLKITAGGSVISGSEFYFTVQIGGSGGGEADLVIDRLEVTRNDTGAELSSSDTVPDGTSITVQVYEKNIGTADAEDFYLAYYDNGSYVDDDYESSTVSAGGDDIERESDTFNISGAGSHTLRVDLDTTDVIAESDESNNSATFTLNVDAGDPADPRLYAGLSTNPTSLNQGETLNVSYTIKNYGGQPITFKTLSVSCRSPNLDNCDFGAQYNVTLNGGQSYTLNARESNFGLPEVYGDYVLKASYQLPDNSWHDFEPEEPGTQTSVSVQVEAPLTPADPGLYAGLSATPTSLSQGDSLNASYTVKNYGDQSITFKTLSVSCRSPNDDNCDFGAVYDVTLDGGQSYTLEATEDNFGVPDVNGTYVLKASYQLPDNSWHDFEPEEPGTQTSVAVTVDGLNPLPPPTLAPIGNADGNGNYTVSWNNVSDATSYVLQEDDNASFSSPVEVYNDSNTSWNASNKAPGSYYYRVKSCNANGCSASWSNTQSTVVCGTPGTPSIPSPTDGATNQSINTNLDWADVAYATSYDVYFGTSSTPPYYGNITSSEFDLPTLDYDTHYYWKIVAKNGCGQTSGSTWEFTIGSEPPPSPPTLNSINNADGDGNYTVSWSNISGVTSYVLQEDDNALFPSPSEVHNGSGTLWNASGKDNGVYHYRVKACDASNCSGWSNTQSVTVNPSSRWQAKWISQEPAYVRIPPSGRTVIQVKFLNTGTETWTRDNVALYVRKNCASTLGPPDDKEGGSIFRCDTWEDGQHRAARLQEAEVRPSEIGTFEFELCSYEVNPNEPIIYREDFGLARINPPPGEDDWVDNPDNGDPSGKATAWWFIQIIGVTDPKPDQSRCKLRYPQDSMEERKCNATDWCCVNYFKDLNTSYGWLRDYLHPTNYRVPSGYPFQHAYDGHQGTDFMGQRYPQVVAAADGYVISVENDNYDHDGTCYSSDNNCDGCPPSNYVLMKYRIGETDYWVQHLHLARHSIPQSILNEAGKHDAQKKLIPQGTILGQVGMTGCTNGPHLHFEVRTQPTDDAVCPYTEDLWIIPEGYQEATCKALEQTMFGRMTSQTKSLGGIGATESTNNQLPIATFTASPTATIGSTAQVTFDAYGSYDPDGHIRAYLWLFGDGKAAGSATVVHTYTVGTFYPYLLVYDNMNGFSWSETSPIIVRPDNLDDVVPPQGVLSISSTNGYISNQTVSTTIALNGDEAPEGIAMRFSHDGESFTEWETFQPAKLLSVPTGDGLKNIAIQFKDSAGNLSQIMGDNIFLDTTPPSVTVTNAATNTLMTGQALFQWTASDNSGASVDDPKVSFRYYLEGMDTAWSETTRALEAAYDELPAGTFKFHLEGTDMAGNITEVTLPITSTPPTVNLTAEPGHASIQLDWNPTNDPHVTTYRVSRAISGTETFTTVVTVTDTVYFDAAPDLIPNTTYCYYVEARQADGSVVVTSNTACAPFSRTDLWVPDTWAEPGETAIVPVNVRNAEGLHIAASDVWLDFDGSVIQPLVISRTALTADYAWAYHITSTASYSRARISAIASPPPQLYGDGSLFWLTFQVTDTAGLTSPLNLRDFISGVGGSTIYAPDDLYNPIPLHLQDGTFHVEGGYLLGDLNGNGVVEAADAYLAMQIANGELTPTWEQRQAGDANGNGEVDTADANMILYYAAHQSWPLPDNIPANRTAALNAASGSQINPILSPDDTQGLPGAVVTTTLRAQNLSGCTGAEFTIVYDRALVSGIIDVTATGLATGFDSEYHDDSAGILHISLTEEGDVLSGSGALAVISLRLASDAPIGDSAPLALAEARLNDVMGRDFATSAIQRTVERHNGAVSITARRIYLPVVLRQPSS